MSRLLRIAQRPLWWLANQAPFLSLESSLARRRHARFETFPGKRRGHLLVTTVGLGNIGDQAMLEAFLDNAEGFVTVVVPHADSLVVPARHRDRARIEHLPGLVDGLPKGRGASLLRFLSLASQSETCSVIGADIMDGGYAPREAVLRCSILELAHSAGATTAVMGFSWNGRAHPAARAALARIAPSTRLYARDPLSAERLRSDGIDCEQVADTVFAYQESTAPPELREWVQTQADRQLVIVNASGLLASKGLTPEYITLLRILRAEGKAVLLLPHVLREGDNDLTACTAVYSEFTGDPAVALAERLLSPAEVSWLTSRADAVFTGRMHLSILALNHGTPVCVVATQGKVEGMMSLFGLERWALQPQAGLGNRAHAALGALLAEELRVPLLTSHREVRRLAERQFEHLR